MTNVFQLCICQIREFRHAIGKQRATAHNTLERFFVAFERYRRLPQIGCFHTRNSSCAITANAEDLCENTCAGLCFFGIDLELRIDNWLGKLRRRLFWNNRFSI